MQRKLLASGLGVTAVLALTSGAMAQGVFADGERTVFLEAGSLNWGAPMNIAHHAGNDQYYGGGGGYGANDATVWDSAGNILQASQVVVDLRSWFYNPATGDIEAVSYNAKGGSGDYGFWAIGLDGSGLLDGSRSLIMQQMPGLYDSQTMPAFDDVNDVLYSSGSGSATVNVVRRSDGSFDHSFSMDLGAAGGSNNYYGLGYDSNMGWLMCGDAALDQVHVFDNGGGYIGSANLDMDLPGGYGFGYANGQVFVWDQTRSGWQGYDIGATGGGGFALGSSGSCPGSMTFTATGATAGRPVAFAYSFQTGDWPIPGGPCAGTVLGIVNPTLAGMVTADGSGSASFTGNVPAAACGRVYVQAVDGATCTPSNVVGL